MKKVILLATLLVSLGSFAQSKVNVDSLVTFLKMDTIYIHSWKYEQKAILVVADTIPQQGVYQLGVPGIVEARVYDSRVRWQFGYVLHDYSKGTITYFNSQKEKLPEGLIVIFYKPEDWK